MLRFSWSLLLFLSAGFAAPSFAQEKPLLAAKDLGGSTYHFEISGDRITGEGAKFLSDEIGRSQYVLLGEYHGSSRISQFTKAIIPVFHQAGCRTFALEIGPVSAEILSELSSDPARTIPNLNEFNTKYQVATGDHTFGPIPFFENVEDAEFLAEARRRKWNLIGLDQEFSFGYVPLIRRMYENLKTPRKTSLEPLYRRVEAEIVKFYAADIKGEASQYKAIQESRDVNDFLTEASKNHPNNARIAEAIRFTTEIYRMNDAQVRKYYEANSRRVDQMKKNLSAGFARGRFDLKRDKMLLKMGAVHTGRGFSDLSLFEIGNTLSELASYHGNRSLHIAFGSRYQIAGGNEVDALGDPNGFRYRYHALLQMGRKDQWTVIDLRPLRQRVFYGRQFRLDPLILEIFKNQDLYVIPPVEVAAKANFTITTK